jgi:eukaryotic-like serine/threonine-protein kinase
MAVDWTRTKEVFTLALERDPAMRHAFVLDACGGDEALLAEVESLLASHTRADSLLENAGAALWHPAFDLNMIGKCVGDYRGLEEAGRGGTSVVYLAERADQHYQKRVAIKILRLFGDGADILQRFRMERQTLAELDHPNIVRLLDGGSTDEGMPYLVMDYVEGVPIDRYCDEHALPITERLRIFRTLCDARGPRASQWCDSSRSEAQ